MVRFFFFLLISNIAIAQKKFFLREAGQLPYITIYTPEQKNSGAAVIICPGGAYAFRSDDGEGVEPAKKLAAEGITGIVLDYRLPVDKDSSGDYSTTFGDLQRAIAHVRQHAKKLHIKPDHVGVMGFSAGGHLCSTIATHFKTDYTGELLGQNLRPDFVILAYAVISMADSLTHPWSRENILGKHPSTEKIIGFSNELQVTDQTPPAFITTAMNDPGVPPQNSLYFAAALEQHHVPVELFIYTKGGHAYGIHNNSADVQWIDACIRWIKNKAWKKKK